MLRRLRNPNSLRRRTLSVLACAALLLQASVPAGYMLDGYARTIVLCPSQGDFPVARPAADTKQDAGHLAHQHKDKHDTADGVCAFALAFIPLVAPSTAPTTDPVKITTEPFIEHHSFALPTYAYTAIPARGPPAHS